MSKRKSECNEEAPITTPTLEHVMWRIDDLQASLDEILQLLQEWQQEDQSEEIEYSQ